MPGRGGASRQPGWHVPFGVTGRVDLLGETAPVAERAVGPFEGGEDLREERLGGFGEFLRPMVPGATSMTT